MTHPTADRSHGARSVVTVHAPRLLGETLRPFAGRFALAGVYFAVLLLFATVGYRFIEDWSWFDAFYMSVTTVSSVGYSEVHPLSSPGRTFTTFVIALGVTGLGIWWALTTALIVELDLGGALRRRRKMKNLENLKGHFIVCGAGRVGRMVVEEMKRAGTSMAVIESDPGRAASLEEADPELLVLCADATKERVLTQARVEHARGLAACLADDADNLLVCLTVRDLNPQLATVARAYDEESMDKLRRGGADHVIAPTLTGGIRMASTLLRPHVVSFLDTAVLGPDVDLRLEEAEIPESSPLAGRTLAEVEIPKRTGMIVIALQRGGDRRDQVYNPGPDVRLSAGDVMIVMGAEKQLDSLDAYAKSG